MHLFWAPKVVSEERKPGAAEANDSCEVKAERNPPAHSFSGLLPTKPVVPQNR